MCIIIKKSTLKIWLIETCLNSLTWFVLNNAIYFKLMQEMHIFKSNFLKSRSFLRILDPEIPTFYGLCFWQLMMVLCQMDTGEILHLQLLVKLINLILLCCQWLKCQLAFFKVSWKSYLGTVTQNNVERAFLVIYV